MEGKGVTIYILELEGGKYYVGKTRKQEPEDRIIEHVIGEGSAWTSKYPPKRIVDFHDNCSDFEEDRYTKEYMAKFGIDNVRGGTYCRLELNDNELQSLTREIRSAEDRCLRCGRESHFASECYAKTHVEDGGRINDTPIKESSSTTGKRKTPPKPDANKKKGSKKKSPPLKKTNSKKDGCYRCGREGHWAEGCYAKSDIDGRTLYDDSPFAYIPPSPPKKTEEAPKYQRTNSRESLKKSGEVGCYRCGREGHWAETCYAKSDIDGRLLYDDSPFAYTPPSPPKRSDEAPKSAAKYQRTNSREFLKRSGEVGCYRCGREGHISDDCYAKSDIDGRPLYDDSPSVSKESPDKASSSSSSFWGTAVQLFGDIGSAILTRLEEQEDCCYRCGRPGHWAEDCYAKTNVNGKRLD